jgi:hypothetical protein
MTLELGIKCTFTIYKLKGINTYIIQERRNTTRISLRLSQLDLAVSCTLQLSPSGILCHSQCAFHFPSEPPLYTLLEALHNGELETCQEIQLTCSVTSEIKLEAAATATPFLPLLLGREERRVRLWFGCIWACDYY